MITTKLPCGCTVEGRRGQFMAFLLKNRLIKLFDTLHSEAFVRAHSMKGSSCAS